MATLKTTLMVMGYISLVLFTIYEGFISSDKNLVWLPIFVWGLIFYKGFLDDRDRAKARVEERFQRLSARIAYLERKIGTMDR
jgi:hypothetical protein